MPWNEATAMSERIKFVLEWELGQTPKTVLCRKYGVSRKTGYKNWDRYRKFGLEGLKDQSRAPQRRPTRSASDVVEEILALRREYPRLGGRKINRMLKNRGLVKVPAPSTITDILRRNGLIDPAESRRRKPFIRFEHERPNQLWQMDFKGHFALEPGRCHPLTVLDDHSRFSVGLKSCPHERGELVERHLTAIFRRSGLPERITMDNGSPWGPHLTTLVVWLIRLGIKVSHSRPYHPQTQGKDERFHRSLKEEWLAFHPVRTLAEAQATFDRWLEFYNFERPHEALDLGVPADHYRPSERAFPEALPEIVYEPGVEVRKVQAKGEIYFKGRVFLVGRALHGLPVALRPASADGEFDVFFCKERVGGINLNEADDER